MLCPQAVATGPDRVTTRTPIRAVKPVIMRPLYLPGEEPRGGVPQTASPSISSESNGQRSRPATARQTTQQPLTGTVPRTATDGHYSEQGRQVVIEVQSTPSAQRSTGNFSQSDHRNSAPGRFGESGTSSSGPSTPAVTVVLPSAAASDLLVAAEFVDAGECWYQTVHLLYST